MGRPWLAVVALCRSVVTSVKVSCRIVEPLIATMVSPVLSPATPAAAWDAYWYGVACMSTIAKISAPKMKLETIPAETVANRRGRDAR